MTIFEFKKSGGLYTGFTVKGHSGHAASGSDIVCAAASSAVETVVNGITDAAKAKANVRIDEHNAAVEVVLQDESPAAQILAEALYIQAGRLSGEYPKSVKLILLEV